MSDLTTMIWKEVAELFGNRRFLWVFTIAILAMGIIPTLALAKQHGHAINASSLTFMILRTVYVLFATAIVVAQTSPDMVLHERVGHTLDYLLTTRLSNHAIFGAKVLISFAVGYVTAILAVAVQLVFAALIGGAGWNWLYLATPIGRVITFGITAALSLYVSVVGTFVAVRVGEQRVAYMISIFAVALLTVPFLTGWIHITLTVQWVTRVAIIFGAIAIILGLVGVRLFRRDMLALYLQD
ncbi:hypothetical protein [Alicyclobacillus fastidiosus]|uniref:ABC transporter permease n=1 Tax=Alicyclobacillus fastidiosus TaxID=392011 RepID=A0ABV5ALM6_9BACL|nr:hypothetical protein [Alicyclobacillus fastidiosus]WEH10590.1 hypothetical protein PYS47_05020 [Alicyclobacillus fastidiosus]